MNDIDSMSGEQADPLALDAMMGLTGGSMGPGPATGAAPASYVSLFLLLLVFFTVLFSISTAQRDRSRLVLSSVDEAFHHLPSRLGLIAVSTPRPAEGSALSQDVSTLFGALVPAARDLHPVAGQALLQIDDIKLFDKASGDLTAEAKTALEKLAVALQRQKPDDRHRLIWEIPRDGDRTAHDLALARAGLVVLDLFRQGCAPLLFAIGSADLPQGTIRLRVTDPAPAQSALAD